MKILTILLLINLACSNLLAQQRSCAIKKVSATELKALIDSCDGPTIIGFWATWCGPCLREIPYMENFVAAASQPIKLLLVNVDLPDRTLDRLCVFVREKGYKSEVLQLNETELAKVSVAVDDKWTGAVPASIFVDRSKNYYRFFDMQLTMPRLSLEIKNLLE